MPNIFLGKRKNKRVTHLAGDKISRYMLAHDEAQETTPGERLIRMDTVRAMTGLSRSSIYREIRKGTFSRAVHPLGHVRLAAWKLSEVQAWIASAASS